MFKRLALAGVVTALVIPATSAAAESGHGHDGDRPDTIDLPAGFRGEGVAVGGHHTFYAGSVADGRVARGDLRDGTSEVFVGTPLVPAATGLKADQRHNLLWVSGAATGQAAVYNLKTGEPVVALTLTTGPAFINDVVVTRNAAYFTNSFAPELYRVPVSRSGEVGAPETIALSGPAADFVAGFNLNGIEATDNGRTLIVINSSKGELYTVDAATGESALIDVGGATFPTGDGILLHGRTLYVLQNGNAPGLTNQINVVKLRRHLTEGKLVDTITSPFFETATTLARKGDILVAVNSQFGGAPIDPESEVVLVDLDDD
jgi:sugar lactone lactonase YvrE